MVKLTRKLLCGTILLGCLISIWPEDAFGQMTISTPSPLPDGVVGTAYSLTLASSGGTGPRTWTLVSGTLPAGLSLSTQGVISGTPNTAGTSSFRIRVTALTSGEKDFTLQINTPVTVTTASPMPQATQGGGYSQTLTASGGEAPYMWSLVSGSLPNGLSRSGATISGIPTQTGSSTFTVRVTDSSNPAQTSPLKSLTIVVVQLTVTTVSPLPVGMSGTAYSQSLAAANGTAPYNWTLTSGSLPAGLTLSNTGTISGTPNATGTSNFTVRVTDGSTPSVIAQKSFALQVLPALTITTSSPLPSGILAAPYSQNLSASGGTGPYTFSIVSGSLPPGLSLSGSTISGTSTGVTTANFTVQVSDSNTPPFTSNKAFVVDIILPPGIPVSIITTSSLPAGAPGIAYSQTLAATGGVTPYSWAVIAGSLPAGLTLTGATISGTPTTGGSSNFTIRVADSSAPPQTFQRSFTVSIAPALGITTSSLPSASTGIAYSQTLAATGGTTPYSWSIVAGVLPAGLTISGATISGTPTAVTFANFTVRVTDSGTPQQTTQRDLSISVGTPLTITTSSPLPPGAAGHAYSQNFAATGGTAGYTWSITVGTLPAGIALSAAGALGGLPTQTGSFDFTVSVSDSSTPARSTTGVFQLTIKPFLAITTSSLPPAAVGSAYSAQLAAAMDPPLTWSLAEGNLPAGIGLSAGGLLSGAPSATGNFSFTIRVTSDFPSQESTRTYQIVVGPALSVATTALPEGTRFVPYTTTLSASGGVLPYSWSVVSGSGNLPAGLSLSSTGVLSGTPTALGPSNFSIRVVDSSGTAASRAFSLSVVQGVLRVTTTSLPGGIQGFAYRHQFEASGGPTPYAWSITNGLLPSGFSLTSAGVLQGSAAALVNSTITVRVTDSAGATDQRDFTLVIVPPLGTVSLTGLQLRVAPAQQVPLALSLPSATPAEIRGTLSLSFSSTASIPVDDPAVQFSTGGRTVNFTIPANTAAAVFPSPLLVMTGTVAGTISISGNIQNGPSGLALTSGAVDSVPPQTTSVVATRINGGLSVRVIGYSPDRSVGEINYAFEVRLGGTVQTVNLARPVAPEFTSWYQSTASSIFGSAFRLEQLFGVGGDTSVIEAITITLRNVNGASTSARVPFTAN